jgi:hypothetical protein
MTLEIVGREDELASIHAFFDQAEGGPAALVLEGEPGIGKSTLWLAGVEKRDGGTASFRRVRQKPSGDSPMRGSGTCSMASSTMFCRR